MDTFEARDWQHILEEPLDFLGSISGSFQVCSVFDLHLERRVMKVMRNLNLSDDPDAVIIDQVQHPGFRLVLHHPDPNGKQS